MTLNSSAVENLYHARMGPNSNTKTHNLDAQTSSNCFEMKRRLHHGVSPMPACLPPPPPPPREDKWPSWKDRNYLLRVWRQRPGRGTLGGLHPVLTISTSSPPREDKRPSLGIHKTVSCICNSNIQDAAHWGVHTLYWRSHHPPLLPPSPPHLETTENPCNVMYVQKCNHTCLISFEMSQCAW